MKEFCCFLEFDSHRISVIFILGRLLNNENEINYANGFALTLRESNFEFILRLGRILLLFARSNILVEELSPLGSC